jgi:NTE family protein
MEEATKSRAGMVFSSGFFGFFAHAGVLAAVREWGLRPDGYAGTSSGAIVAAMAACNMKDEEIRGLLFSLRKEDFWDPDPPGPVLMHLLKRFRGWTGYLRGQGFARLLENIPVRRIQDCPIPLVVAATDLTQGTEAVFKRGDLISAVHASGAVPGLFKPVRVNGSWCVDGGMVDKAPVRALAERIRPSRILVHYMASDNLSARPDAFLEKAFTPWHIHSQSVNIARRVSYEHQVALVRARGTEVIEIRTRTPAMGPNSLLSGPSAYAVAREQTLEFLRGSRPS